MRVCESIADVKFKGNLQRFMEKDFLIKIEDIIKKDPYASRCLMITATENHDFKFLDNIIHICQSNLYPKKEFILDSHVCLECDTNEMEIEFYLYDYYECIQKDDVSLNDTNFLSDLLADIKTIIDKALGDSAYIDIYVKQNKIIITIEEKYFRAIENIVLNHCIKTSEYTSSFLQYEAITSLVQINIINTERNRDEEISIKPIFLLFTS